MTVNNGIGPATRELIETRLAAIAEQGGVKILYACESGSRAWGFASPDSDYDVRFIYAHPLSWYLTLEEGRDVIDLPLEDSTAGLLDIGGWDLRKTLRLLRKSNPVIWEWLQSPLLYSAGLTLDLREFRSVFDPFFSPIAACHHYSSICRNTLNQELRGGTVKIKKYFYMLRPLLAAVWIQRHEAIPPMEFALLLPLLDDRPKVKSCIADLLERKLHTDERIPIDRVATIDDFLIGELARLDKIASLLPAGQGDSVALNNLFQQLLGV